MPGYKGVGVIHSKENDKQKIRYCSRCEDLFQVRSILGKRILGVGEVKQSDYDLWLQCRNCGSLYQKHEVKVQPDLDSVKVLSDGRQGKIQGIEKKDRKKISRGKNPRLKNNRWEIKDTDLQRELKDGAELISYYSNEPLV